MRVPQLALVDLLDGHVLAGGPAFGRVRHAEGALPELAALHVVILHRGSTAARRGAALLPAAGRARGAPTTRVRGEARAHGVGGRFGL